MSLRFSRHPIDAGESRISGGFGDWYGSYRHRGVDYAVKQGTTVYAPADGICVQPTNDGSFGIAVCIDHHEHPWRFTLYAHLSKAYVQPGDQVQDGQIIGLTGNTGKSTGPHLHWQLCQASTFPLALSYSTDPIPFIEEEDLALKEELTELRAEFNTLRRNIYGTKGPLLPSEIKARERSEQQEKAMVAGELPSLAERLQGHIEDQESHS